MACPQDLVASASKKTPKVELKVIGVGLMRTGTSSLKMALETLSFGPCYHMSEVIRNPHHFQMWTDNAEDLIDVKAKNPKASLRYERFTNILDSFGSTTDVPACLFYEELFQIYPNAKFILSTRDVDQWLDSCRKTVLRRPPAYQAVGFFIASRFNWTNQLHRMFMAGLRYRFGEVHYEDDAWWKKIYAEHIERVKSVIPSDQLLIFNPSEGWEPLCSFLGVEVPHSPFPHVNTKEEMTKMLTKKYSLANKINIGLLITHLAVLTLGILKYRQII